MHQKLNHNLLVLLPLIILGIYLCYIGDISDEDTLAMINSLSLFCIMDSIKVHGLPVIQ